MKMIGQYRNRNNDGRFSRGIYWTDDRIKTEIRRISALGIPPNWTNVYNHLGLKGLVTAGGKQFGSWSNAVVVSGLNPDEIKGVTFPPKKEPVKTCACGCGKPVSVDCDFYHSSHALRLPEHRETQRRITTMRWKDPKQRKKMTEAQTVAARKPERRREAAEYKRAHWSRKSVDAMAEYNRGRPKSEEHKHKISDSNIGKKHTPESIEKMSGPNNHGWKGGVSYMEYPEEFNDELKYKIRKRDGFVCQKCHEHKPLSVHHIDLNKFNNKEDNLISLCKSCHMELHNKMRPPRQMITDAYLKEGQSCRNRS